MTTRELSPGEWASFFNSFSRVHGGEPVTVELLGDGAGERPRTLARRSPLIGITVETEYEADDDDVKAIQIALATAEEGHLVHVLRQPRVVKVGQISNGADDLLVIESAAGDATVRIWFGPASDAGTSDIGSVPAREAIDHAAEPYS